MNDILDLSKIEAGSMRLEKVPMDPQAVLRDVMEVLRYRAEESGLVLEVDIAPDVPARVLGDPTRLNQVLLNLVGNATKFTERGPGERIRSCEGASDRCGDAPVQHHRYGHRHRAGSAALRLRGVHTGRDGAYPDLRRYRPGPFHLQALGGDAGWHHRRNEHAGPGEHLHVHHTVWLTEADRDTVQADDHRPTGSSSAISRILLAEDNKMNVMVAKEELKYAIPGARIDVAANGQLAVDMVGQNDYDLVLMDVRMPVLDGFAATRAIRALGGDKSRIPIVAMTANVLGQGPECTAAGMDAYVPKPIQSEVLLARLREVLQH